MRKIYFLPLLTSIFFSNLLFSAVNFSHYCKQYKDKRFASNEGIAHTTKVLYELSSKKTCDDAYTFLKGLKSLDLSNQEITTLTPLSGLSNLDSLDISFNNLQDLWGIEDLINLSILIANDNRLENITPLANMQELNIVNLENNALSYASPLKELSNIKYYSVEGNPIFASEEEMDYLDSMIFFRKLQRRGLDYQFDPGDPSEDLYLQIFMAADRADFPFFRTVLSNSAIRARLTEKGSLMSCPLKTQKMIIAVCSSEDLVESLIQNYTQIKKINPFSHHVLSRFFRAKRAQLRSFFEFYLAEGKKFPKSFADLKALERFLIREMKKRPTLDPRDIKILIEKWNQGIEKLGIPPSLTTGFLSS